MLETGGNMLSNTGRVFFNRVRSGLVGIVGVVVFAVGCTEQPKSNSSTGGQGGGGGAGGAGGEGGSPPVQIEWTVFKESSDTQKVHVSSSDGNDANDGSAPDKAVKTLAKGISLLRDGMPDWMLLKRGDVWLESFGEWSKSGRNATEPMVVMTYGTEEARPVLKTGSQPALVAIAGPLRHLAFVGLHLYAHTRDPETIDFMGANGGPGIQWLAPSDDLLFEDMMVQFYAVSNINLKASMTNVRVRRSVIVDSYDVSDHAQGIYLEGVQGVLIEENAFDHNGWNTHPALMGLAAPTLYNHNLHVQSNCTDVTIRGNLSVRAASHGIQARAGGTVTDNLVLENPVGLSFGLVPDSWDPKVGGVTGTVAGNVVRDGGDIDATNARGIGIQLGNIQSATVEGNILAHDSSMGTSSIAIDVRRKTNPLVADEKVQNLTIQNNVIYDWRGGIRFGTSALVAVSIQNNDVQESVRASELVNYFGATYTPETTYGGNHWFSLSNPGTWFTLGATAQSFDQWLVTTSEQGATNTEVVYADTERRLGDYHQTLGKEASFGAYMLEVRKQSQKNWRVEYSAKSPIAYIREGFGKK
jgi:Right handed beta helix region